jgi:cytochrome bd ubiquinol oxidase subunit II
VIELYQLPLVFALAGLAFYVVLGGADFGAGFWQLAARNDPGTRGQTYRAIGPVWEANHVWLVFVLTVVWTAYPVAFGSIASTLSIPLFLAAVGIIFRGTAYALHSGARARRSLGAIDAVFSCSSILTPFFLGAVVGGIASLRVPVGNSAGDHVTSWVNPTSMLIGVLAVVTAAYLAAVFLSGDAARLGDAALEASFRRRALGAGIVAGGIAIAGLPVVRNDAPELYHGLVHGRGLVAVLVSALAGALTLALVWTRRYEPARYGAALAVAAIIAGWALAQSPLFLEDLTVRQAAAPHDTLVAVVVAVVVGGVLLFPSLALLFGLVLRGRFEAAAPGPPAPGGRELLAASEPGLLGRAALGCLIAGAGFTVIGDAAWAHAIGLTLLFGFIVLGFPAALPPEVFGRGGEPARRDRNGRP